MIEWIFIGTIDHGGTRHVNGPADENGLGLIKELQFTGIGIYKHTLFNLLGM